MAEEEIPEFHKSPRPDAIEALPINDNDVYLMYMRYIPPHVIAKNLNVSVNRVARLIKSNDWKKERDSLHKDLKKAVKQQALARLNSITTNGLLIADMCIKHTIKAYKAAERVPSVTEAEIIMKIVKIAHFIKNHDEAGGASGEVFSMNPEEVLESFMNDPYMRKMMKQDSIELIPTLEAPNNGNDEDSDNLRNSERSASQEARASAARTE